jgi:site-specific DNA-methyltransferase (adenine-specific)
MRGREAATERGEMIKPYYEERGITIYNADCREVLPELDHVGLIFADPPYGVKLGYKSTSDHQRDIQVESWLRPCRIICQSIIVTPGYVNLFKYPKPDYVAIRFDKTAQSPATIAWMNKWEPIFFYGKPSGKLKWDVIETACQSERSALRIDHPCPKPYSLLIALLGAFGNGKVLDPFMGSGTTLRAAKDLGREAIGIEIDENYCEIAVNRLKQKVLALT